jgi:SAM-dependent methyltransferase
MRHHEYDIMASVQETHWWYRELRAHVLSVLAPVVGGQRATIVDAGCGTGWCYRAVRERWPDLRYIGVDVSSAALAYSRDRGLTALAQGSVDALPLRSECADVVIALDVLYFATLNFERALGHCFRVLRPNGVLILNLPTFAILRGRHDDAVGIARRFRRPALRSALEAAGFKLLTATYWNAILFVPMLVWRWLSRWNEAAEPSSDLAHSPKWLDPILGGALAAERALARHLSLPLGSSVLVVARRPV